MTPPRKKGFWAHFFSNMNDPVIRVLLIALAVNLIFVFRTADWVETLGIGISVLLATFISTLSEYGSENAFARLKMEEENFLCRVRRDGVIKEIPLGEIVVGDILLLSAGDKIAADGFLIEGALSVDQSAMTGETKEVAKTPRKNEKLSPESRSALLRECTVVSGEGEMEVTVVGDKTFIGEISREISLDTRQSPLKLRLTRLASQISRLGYAAAVLVGVVYLINALLLDCGMDRALILSKLTDLPFMLNTLLDAFTLGLTVVVVAVPEGLPMMIAVVLSSNIKKMTRDMVLVRKPVGIEAAGSMNLLFTDKTGTLTEGKLCVTEVFTSSESFPSASKCRDGAKSVFELLRLCACYNTEATLSAQKISGGNATERALLSFFSFKDTAPVCRVLSKQSFDSNKKYSSASISVMGGITLFKGAPERLLPFVTHAIDKNGESIPFDKAAFLSRMDSLTKGGSRVLLTAFTRKSDTDLRHCHGRPRSPRGTRLGDLSEGGRHSGGNDHGRQCRHRQGHCRVLGASFAFNRSLSHIRRDGRAVGQSAFRGLTASCRGCTCTPCRQEQACACGTGKRACLRHDRRRHQRRSCPQARRHRLLDGKRHAGRQGGRRHHYS